MARPRTPRSNGRGGTNVGLASPPFTQWTSALSSPATYRDGRSTARMWTASTRAARRSSSARATVTLARRSGRSSAMTTSEASTASAASAAPSSTRCGRLVSNHASFALAGSPSEPLAITKRGPRPLATARILVAVGKPLPPRPRRPLRSTKPITSTVRRRPKRWGAAPSTRDVRGQRLVARGVGDETRQPDRRGDEGFGRACHQWSSPLDDDLGDVLAALTEPLTTPPGMSRWVIWIAIGCCRR